MSEYRLLRSRLAPLALACLVLSFLCSLPATAREPDFVAHSKDLKCLATAVYFEARGEPLEGQVAVAQVVLNRLHSDRYPKTICGVVYQNAQLHNRCQFSFACDGKPDIPREADAWSRAESVAAAALANPEQIWVLGDATLYHARYVSPSWAPKVTLVASIGQHLFYEEAGAGPEG